MELEKLKDMLYNAAGGPVGIQMCHEATDAIEQLQTKNEELSAKLERMKTIMRNNGIMIISSKYPGGRSEWNIPKPRGPHKED